VKKKRQLWRKCLNPFGSNSKNKLVFDESPKMGAGGTVYITKVTMSIRMNREQWVCDDEQLIFSEREVPTEQIMELDAIVAFLAKNPHGRIEVNSFECDLKTVRTKVIVEGR